MSTVTKKPYYEALPTALSPYHYHLSISDIDIKDEKFKGKVEIDLKIVEDTDELHLNYRDLIISKENIKVELVNGETVTIIDIESLQEFKQKEFFIVKFNQLLKSSPDSSLKVTLNYDGIVQTNMAGFYKSSYVENGEEKFMLSTQFEATDARRCFPCFDEPLLKSTFKVEIEIPDKSWIALGNTPVESITKHSTTGNEIYTFELTPIMSTYLLAWAVGEFEYIESFTEDIYHDNKPLPCRIYTTKGGDHLENAKLASEITPKIVDYFSKIFEIKYPLPKLDLIAVHSFSHNAMENWGLITYRSTALLYSETKSDPSYKQKVAYVVAHELAHQWFGNLVTMKWWDELWLNEGFATWVGYSAVDYLFPEWDIFSGFVSESLQQALTLDGLRNSHPIEVPVIDALDIDQVFDAISYLKGASTILMISNYLGKDLFLKGVALYLNTHKYDNATSHDLWNAIGQVSNKQIDQIMNEWIKKIGYPIIDVSTSTSNDLVLKQSRFLNGGDVTPAENETKWWIPLSIASGKDVDTSNIIDSFESETLIIDNFPLVSEFFKLNKDTTGVYRVNYSNEILEKNILPFYSELSVRDKVGLIADSTATSIAGNNSTVSLLKLIKSIKHQLGDDYSVWLELGKNLNKLLTVFTNDESSPLSTKLTSFVRSVYETKAEQLISDFGSETKEDFLTVKLRSDILSHAGLLSIPKVEAFALELFEQWTTTGEIDPSLRSFVFSTIAHSTKFNEDQFNLIFKEITNPTSLDSREVALNALGHINNKELSTKLIANFLKPEIIPIMDSHYLGIPLSKNSLTKESFLDFFLTNYDQLYKLMSTNMVVLDRFIRFTLGNYNKTEIYNKIENFFKGKDIHGFERSLKLVLDDIKINQNWYNRDKDEIEKFLS
ncbi:arginine/alanine aminopeptidase [Scheffersomyces coipomensis]|uniref:arginine/alanine aminopeptidase n=1 Tax=Scheffersomyces coipomensis TaxID=1788519 RepID=UPI00315CCA9A